MVGYQRPDGTPKKTGRTLHEGIATVRIDDSQAENGRVAIHVEHPDHDGGVRCFYRHRESNIARTLRSHLKCELDDDLARVEIIDEAGVGITEGEVLPRRMARETPASAATEVTIN